MGNILIVAEIQNGQIREASFELATVAGVATGSGGIEGMYALFFTEPLIPKGFLAPTLLVWRFMAYYLTIAVGLVITTHVLDRWRKYKAIER